MVPGQEILVTAEGFKAGSDVQLWLYSTPVLLDTVVAAADGTVAATVRIPTDTPAGDHAIVALGVDPDGLALRLEAAITVTAVSPPATDTISGHDGTTTPLLPLTLMLIAVIASLSFLSTEVRRGHDR